MAEIGSETVQKGEARSPRGTFLPGNVGGPGRPRKSEADRRLEQVTRRTLDRVLEQRLGRALAVIDKALRSRVDLQLAFKAAQDVLDRVGGKAVQRVEASFDPNTGPARVIGPDDLRAAALAVLALQTVDAEDAVLKQTEAAPADPVEIAAGLALVDGQVVAK